MPLSPVLIAGLFSALLVQALPLSAKAEKEKPLNVLFISADDLRPSLGCYGDPVAITPHIDRLAKQGLVFNRAYCQQAVCSPSRTSLMTGLRPETTRVFDLKTDFRDTVPDVVTLPQLFRHHGYHSQAVGKIYHSVKSYSLGDDSLDDEPSWSVPGWLPQLHYYHTPEGMQIAEKWFNSNRKSLLKRYPRLESQTWKDAVIRGLPRESPDVPDESVSDAQITTRAIEILNEKKDEPFFLAVGFLKPHVPFVAPKRYFDMYPLDKISSVPNPYFPKGAPKFAGINSREMRVYHGIPKKGPVAGEEEARELYRAYYACVSFIDAQVGRLLDELDRLNLRDNTIVILWGDHGYHLGENGIWCKQTNFELSTRVPLIISSPNQKVKGARTDALVELVDIYPTLAELCELPLPESLEGLSFKPLLNDPERPWKTAAFSLYPRNVSGKGRVMGRSMKTERYRFTEWTNSKGDFRVVELYDHQNDSEENQNVANLPENRELIKKLTKRLRAGWKIALPPERSGESEKNTKNE
ncbi:MAG: sulfatase [Verrucomicrobiota bacterium]